MNEKKERIRSIEFAAEESKQADQHDIKCESRSNYFSSLGALISNTVGVTVLQMPKLFYESGIIMGIAQIVGIGLLTYLSGSVLCSTAIHTKSRSYSELITRILGDRQSIPIFLFFLLLVGNIICYHTFVLKNIAHMLRYLFDLQLESGSLEFACFAIGLTVWEHLLILPFLFSRKLKIVRILTSASSAAILIGVITIIAIYIWPHFFELKISSIDWERVELYKLDGLSVSIGYYLLSFCFHLSVIDVAQELRPSSLTAADKIVFANYLIAVIVYIAVSCAGYFTVYLDGELGSMTNYLTYFVVEKQNKSSLLSIANFFVLLSITFANILNYVPLIKLFKSKFNKKQVNTSQRTLESLGQLSSAIELDSTTLKKHEEYQKKNTRIIWIIFGLILIIHVLLELFRVSLDIIFDFVGALCGPLVLLVLPGVIQIVFIQTKRSSTSKESLSSYSELALGYFLIAVGLFLWGVGLYELGSS